MKRFVAVASVTIMLASGAVGGTTASAARGPNRVKVTFAESLRVTVSAPGSVYRIGAPVPITVSMTNTHWRYAAPIRWSCHQFAQIHVVTTSHDVRNSTQDLGPATLLHPSGACESAIGWLRPHHTWVATQDVILLHPHLAAMIGFVVHNVDTPGWADEPTFTPVLNFTLLKGSGK